MKRDLHYYQDLEDLIEIISIIRETNEIFAKHNLPLADESVFVNKLHRMTRPQNEGLLQRVFGGLIELA